MLTIKTDWAYRRYDHLYGSFTYDGGGVFGFRSTRFGVPLDTFGRNVYVDTFNSGVRGRLEAREQLSHATVPAARSATASTRTVPDPSAAARSTARR